MLFLPGFTLMPTALFHAVLGLSGERGVVVRGPDRLAVISPMFEEEDGAGPALDSLLAQWAPIDQIAITINGGRDATPRVVASTLRRHGYERAEALPFHYLGAELQRWERAAGPEVLVLEHAAPTSKADGINALVAGGYVHAERILVVDGDTRFDPAFVRELRDAFYELRVTHVDGRRRYVLEDIALQSGAVASLPPESGRMARLVSQARTAEYGFAVLLRRGQTRRLGRGSVLGASRLYTAVGCGFVARSDAFPMPSDTLTEDHDFSLDVQNRPDEEARVDAATLETRGFRIVRDGREIAPSDYFDRDDEIVLRRTSNATFVTGAAMYTDDPRDLGGYVRQVERWTTGGFENALKRLVSPGAWRGLRGNVRFTVLASQLEVLANVLFVLALPAWIGWIAASQALSATEVLSLLGMFFVVGQAFLFLLVTLGLTQMHAAVGLRGRALRRRVLREALRAYVPMLLFRYINLVCYLTAIGRAVPAFVRRRWEPDSSRTWVRARNRTGAGRTQARFGFLAAFVVAAWIGAFEGGRTWRGVVYGTEAARLVAGVPPFDMNDHVALPVSPDRIAAWGADASEVAATPAEPVLPTLGVATPALAAEAASLLTLAAASGPGPFEASGPPPAGGAQAPGATDRDGDAAAAELVRVALDVGPRGGLSRYCRPDFVASSAVAPRTLGEGAGEYVPLTAWQRLTLARLAPLLAHLEEAATAYDVDPQLLLRILINESYLDPLAVGPTEDLGLSQVTSDALTLLRAVSDDPASPFANPRLFEGPFSVFDPDFSICAGAAKLAWARAQPSGEDPAVAYARYINPTHGVVRGEISDVHAPLVAPMMELTPLTDAIAAAVAAYRRDPALVAPEDRALLEVARDVREASLPITMAYRRAAGLVDAYAIDDAPFYERVLGQLFDLPEASVGPAEREPAAPPAGG